MILQALRMIIQCLKISGTHLTQINMNGLDLTVLVLVVL